MNKDTIHTIIVHAIDKPLFPEMIAAMSISKNTRDKLSQLKLPTKSHQEVRVIVTHYLFCDYALALIDLRDKSMIWGVWMMMDDKHGLRNMKWVGYERMPFPVEKKNGKK
jgi:hypothetical protein